MAHNHDPHRPIARWRASRRGSITVMFALSALIVLTAAGMAIDYIMYLQERDKLAAVADAAVLAAVSEARRMEEDGKGEGLAGKAGRNAAIGMWDANTQSAGVQEGSKRLFAIDRVGANWNASVTYWRFYRPHFMSLVGVDRLPIEGYAEASTQIVKPMEYWEFHIVVDTSASMGIGASEADMENMFADPEMAWDRDPYKDQKCMFACHVDKNNEKYDNTVAVARRNGHRLRIDIVEDAVGALIDTMLQKGRSGYVSVQLWGMSDDARVLVPLTTTLKDVRSYNILIDEVQASIGNTHFPQAMETITESVGRGFVGKAAKWPRKAVFIITDGVYDTDPVLNWGVTPSRLVKYDDGNGHHVTGPFEARLCNSLKGSNVVVGTLQVDYYGGFYGAKKWVEPIRDYIKPGLRECASPGLFRNATSPAGIQNALQSMLEATMLAGEVRLTE
ncbi:pilus assembly protein TadG-related protein [Aestuariivirga sp.]|uniref:pilus assembly protein TadG-related protein n=1 Tax=Aestuariivirga sp. TaxID=2650926 RepID=UPI00391D9DE8